MPFTITINTDNADFTNGDQYDPTPALAELLRNIADTIEGEAGTFHLAPTSIGSIRDRNGNHVGEWRHDA